MEEHAACLFCENRFLGDQSESVLGMSQEQEARVTELYPRRGIVDEMNTMDCCAVQDAAVDVQMKHIFGVSFASVSKHFASCF